jgi:hypothetical protein
MTSIFLGFVYCVFLHQTLPSTLQSPVAVPAVSLEEPAWPHQLNQTLDTTKLKAQQIHIDSVFAQTRDLKAVVDFCVIEMQIGSLETGVSILEGLVPQLPGYAPLHAALCYGYERLGKFKKALASAKIYYKLQPNGCENTGGLHIKTLEILANPLGRPENILATNIHIPLAQFKAHHVRPETIAKYQETRIKLFTFLALRAPIFPKPNATMAQLMIDEGDYHYLTSHNDVAEAWYREALAWDASKQELIQDRMQQLNQEKWFRQPWFIWGLCAVVLGFGFIFFKRSKLRRAN